jgi:GT2 family glycosyltransferase
MDLSVIIVNYNVKAFLEHSLLSIREALKGLEGEVLVVDNASDDGSVEMVRQKFPEVRLIVNQRNVGFAAANNIGIRESSGEYLLLLNPDTVVQEDTFHVMAEFFKMHGDAGMAGCKILNPDGTLQLACRRSFPTPWVAFTKVVGLSAMFPNSTLFGQYNLTYRNPDEVSEVDAVSGSFMFLRRSIVENIGGLDEQFFMYGEDLDFCYRVKKAGWKIFYVPATRIIHYKGESVRRSDIDEVGMFYKAMRIFVRKHIRRGIVSDIILLTGIALRQAVAFLVRVGKPLRLASVDFFLVDVSLFLGELLWFGKVFHFPLWAYRVTMTVPGLLVVATMYSAGVYTARKSSLSRVAGGVFTGYIVISALTFFFPQYAFSRMVVAISGIVSVLLLPGWRLIMRIWARTFENGQRSILGRATVIVGTGASGQEILRRLRARADNMYDVVGFVDLSRKRIGEHIAGVEILGSIDNIGRVVDEHRVAEVIFSTDSLTYADILAVIARRGHRSVNFRLVPSSLEVIIGKAQIDALDDIPLVAIDYNIDKLWHRFWKRAFDVLLSASLLATAYPVVIVRMKTGWVPGKVAGMALLLPNVLNGAMSFVGPAGRPGQSSRNGMAHGMVYGGKPGLVGLAQLHDGSRLAAEDQEQYDVLYAKNQSFVLDLEILLKSFILLMKG